MLFDMTKIGVLRNLSNVVSITDENLETGEIGVAIEGRKNLLLGNFVRVVGGFQERLQQCTRGWACEGFHPTDVRGGTDDPAHC
jgi:hypothetical protein